jgi:hypothetical protein
MPRGPLSERTRQRMESEIRVRDQTIEELKQALRTSLSDILFELPHSTYAVVSAPGVTSEEDLRAWRADLANRVLALAEPKSGADMGDPWYNGERAYCPLCSGSASPIFKPHDTGFAYPSGLMMHLQGSGNANRCPVMSLAIKLAKARIDLPGWWK